MSVGRGCAGPARVLSGIRSSFDVSRATAGLLPTLVGTGGSGSSGRLPSLFLVAVAAASLALTSASVRKDIAEAANSQTRVSDILALTRLRNHLLAALALLIHFLDCAVEHIGGFVHSAEVGQREVLSTTISLPS